MTYIKAKRNIKKILREATAEDMGRGVDWYFVAQSEAVKLAHKYNLPYRVVAHVIAALSPNISWELNLKAAALILGGHDGPVAGYRKNVEKARRILAAYRAGEEWDGILQGPKVTEFARNIIDPKESMGVTVDTHAYSVAAGVRYTAETCPSITDKRRRAIADAYTSVSREYGLTPSQCQAVAWVVWKRKIKEKEETEK